MVAKRLGDEWAKIKPKVRERVERHSPELAKVLDEVDDVQLQFLAGEPEWHVFRFSKQLHAARPQRPGR